MDNRLTRGRHDQIQRPSIRLDSLGRVTSSGDKGGSAHLFRVLLLSIAVTDDRDIGTHGFSEKNSKVTKSTKTDDSDIFGSRTSAILHQWRVNSGTSAQHGGSGSWIHTLGNRDDESSWPSPVVGVSTV